MTTFIAVSLVFICVGGYWRRLHQREAERNFVYKIEALSDQLKHFAIIGEIDTKSDHYLFFNQLLSSVSEHSYYFTIFSLTLARSSSDDQKSIQVKSHVQEAVSEHPFYNQIFEGYSNALRKYLHEQHFVTFELFKPAIFLIFGTKVVRSWYKNLIKESLNVVQGAGMNPG